MGISSKDSALVWIKHDCPILLDGSPPSGDAASLTEEVTRMEITPEVYVREYGHDKSFGCQDATAGIKKWNGSISTKVADPAHPATFGAGQIAWIRVFPLGIGCTQPIQGYMLIRSDPIIMNLENGDPVEHNYTYSSKGKWTGMVNTAQDWGGFECSCSGDGSTLGAGSAGPWAAKDLPGTKPSTFYQWNDVANAWVKVYDESGDGFMPGPMPSDGPAFPGEMRAVECLAG